MSQNQIVAPPPPTAASSEPQAWKWIPNAHTLVTAPLKASAITGALWATIIGAGALGVIWFARLMLLDWLAQIVFGWFVIWLIVTTWCWHHERAETKQHLWDAELRDKRDYDGDGLLGKPEPMFLGREKRKAEDLAQLRFETFIKMLYAAESTTTETIRALPEPPCAGGRFTEPERNRFLRALREATPPLVEMERGGKTSAWHFISATADECIRAARQRIMWRIMDGTLGDDGGGQ